MTLESNLQLDFDWLRIRNEVKEMMGLAQVPDLQAVLLLVGVNEVGTNIKETYTKEEKRDFMHVAVCALLPEFYEFESFDSDGWPHFKQIDAIPFAGVKEQEQELKRRLIAYFDDKINNN